MKPKNLEDLVAELTACFAEYWGARRGLPEDELVGVWRPALERAVENAWTNLVSASDITHSPIEDRFLAALWVCASYPNKVAIGDDGDVEAWSGYQLDHDLLKIVSQFTVGNYKADFLLEFTAGPHTVQLAIELDGHDFHEKTKAQAARDKKRDRFFTASGLSVLRFTGSEIFKDADACVLEVSRLLGAKMKEAWDRGGR